MFCPKCGTKNPEDGKFCRKCGTDLAPVSVALTGGSSKYTESGKKNRKSKTTWESAMGKLFMGIGFLVIAVILGYTGAAGGQAWWFWMLIPGFAMLGSGVAQIIQLRTEAPPKHQMLEQPEILEEAHNRALPNARTEFVSNEGTKNYETGDLVPSSVVENTTRHLKMDSEGKTMTLPNPDDD